MHICASPKGLILLGLRSAEGFPTANGLSTVRKRKTSPCYVLQKRLQQLSPFYGDDVVVGGRLPGGFGEFDDAQTPDSG